MSGVNSGSGVGASSSPCPLTSSFAREADGHIPLGTTLKLTSPQAVTAILAPFPERSLEGQAEGLDTRAAPPWPPPLSSSSLPPPWGRALIPSPHRDPAVTLDPRESRTAPPLSLALSRSAVPVATRGSSCGCGSEGLSLWGRCLASRGDRPDHHCVLWPHEAAVGHPLPRCLCRRSHR